MCGCGSSSIIYSEISIGIAAIACIISGATYFSQRRHNKKSVKPIPGIIRTEEPLSIKIINNGIGPAIITDICVSTKNPSQKGSKKFADFIKENGILAKEKYMVLTVSKDNPIAILPGEEYRLFEVTQKELGIDESTWGQIVEIGDTIKLTFKDIYDDGDTKNYAFLDIPSV